MKSSTISVDVEFIYYLVGKKNSSLRNSSSELVYEFEGQIQNFRLSPDGKFASVIYSNIVTIISCGRIAENYFYPILDDDQCPLKDAIWSHDSKWLFIRRGRDLPKQDLIKINTKNS